MLASGYNCRSVRRMCEGRIAGPQAALGACMEGPKQQGLRPRSAHFASTALALRAADEHSRPLFVPCCCRSPRPGATAVVAPSEKRLTRSESPLVSRQPRRSRLGAPGVAGRLLAAASALCAPETTVKSFRTYLKRAAGPEACRRRRHCRCRRLLRSCLPTGACRRLFTSCSQARQTQPPYAAQRRS